MKPSTKAKTYYALAYKDTPEILNDPMVSFSGRPIVVFTQGEREKNLFSKWLVASYPYLTAQSQFNVYAMLEQAIAKEVGYPVELIFTPGQPTVWQKKHSHK